MDFLKIPHHACSPTSPCMKNSYVYTTPTLSLAPCPLTHPEIQMVELPARREVVLSIQLCSNPTHSSAMVNCSLCLSKPESSPSLLHGKGVVRGGTEGGRGKAGNTRHCIAMFRAPVPNIVPLKSSPRSGGGR